jgi:hypothetical protein
MIEKIIALLIGDLFKKKPFRLWGIKRGDKSWRNFGTGSMRRLRLYRQLLFGEGWRTLICAKDIIAPAVPPDNEI